MNETKYYRNVVQVEILSDRPWGDVVDLEEINYQITNGDSSGRLNHTVIDEQVSAEQMAELLTAQGSEPSFLIAEDDVTEDYLDDDEETTS